MAKLFKNKKNKLVKKEVDISPLGGDVIIGKNAVTGEEVILPHDGRDYKEETEKTRRSGIPDSQKLQITGLSKKTALVDLTRDGTTDEKLAAILLSPTSTQEQKDSLLSLYLFERGKESSSFLAELFASKGQHTKETRAFKTQMRRDYEVIVDALSSFMELSSSSILSTIAPSESLELLELEALDFIKDGKHTLAQFAKKRYPKNPALGALLVLAIRFHSESVLLLEKVESVLTERLKESKYGQYLSPSGKVFDTSSPTFMEDIANDIREMKEEEAKKVDNKNIKSNEKENS